MSDLQAIADRFEIKALRGEFTDAAMMHTQLATDRLVSAESPGGSSTASRPDGAAKLA